MGSPHQVLLSPTTPKSPKSQTKETQERVQRGPRMAAMAVANYKRRIQQQQQQQQVSLSLQESQDQASTNFKQQSTQSSVSDHECFSSARPTTNFTGEANSNGTKKWSCDADGVTINTKWFPSSTSRATKRLSFSGQEFLSAWGQD